MKKALGSIKMVNFEHSKELKKDVLSLLHARNKTEKSAFFMSSPSSKFTLSLVLFTHTTPLTLLIQ